MTRSAPTADAKRASVVLTVIGAAVAAMSWTVPQAALADFFAHPARANAAAHAMESADAARLGWTVLAAALCGMGVWLRWPRRGRGAGAAAPAARVPRALVLLATLALIVRLLRVNESLWYDEIAALATYIAHGPGPIMGNAFTTANHPLQSLLSWMSMSLSVDPGIRLPSIVAGPVAVWGVWKFTRQVTGEGVALTAAAVMALAPAAVLASGEARGYALSIALAAWANALMLSMLRGTDRPLTIVWYALVMALATWAHLVTVCLAVGHFVVAAGMLARGALRGDGDRRAAARCAMFAVVCAGLLSLGLWAPALPDLLHTRDQFLALTGNEPKLAGNEGAFLVCQLAGTYGLAAAPALVVVVAGLIAALRRGELRLAVSVAALGVPLAVLAAWLGHSWLYARFLLFAMPASAFLIAIALGAFWNYRRWIAVACASLIAIFWLLDVGLRTPKQPLREAIEFVAANKAPGDTVAIITPADNVGQWYALAHGFELLPTGRYGSELDECLARSQPAPKWIVALYPDSISPAAHAALRRDKYTGIARFRGWVDWGHGDIVIFERDSTRSVIRAPKPWFF